MYWRKDPKIGGTFSGPPDWPRNGAVLKGVEHEVQGARWLEVHEFKPTATAAFVKTPGCWMPFDQVPSRKRVLHCRCRIEPLQPFVSARRHAHLTCPFPPPCRAELSCTPRRTLLSEPKLPINACLSKAP